MNGQPTLRGLLTYCAAKYGVTPAQMRRAQCSHRARHAVQEFSWRARHATSASPRSIAKMVDSDWQSSILQAAMAYERRERAKARAAA